jgi:hypothetical protein
MILSVQAAARQAEERTNQFKGLGCRRTVRRQRRRAGVDIRSGRRRARPSRGNRRRGSRNNPSRGQNRPLPRPASPTIPSQLCAHQGRQTPARNAGPAPAKALSRILLRGPRFGLCIWALRPRKGSGAEIQSVGSNARATRGENARAIGLALAPRSAGWERIQREVLGAPANCVPWI